MCCAHSESTCNTTQQCTCSVTAPRCRPPKAATHTSDSTAPPQGTQECHNTAVPTTGMPGAKHCWWQLPQPHTWTTREHLQADVQVNICTHDSQVLHMTRAVIVSVLWYGGVIFSKVSMRAVGPRGRGSFHSFLSISWPHLLLYVTILISGCVQQGS